jgi:hypothetical protein
VIRRGGKRSAIGPGAYIIGDKERPLVSAFVCRAPARVAFRGRKRARHAFKLNDLPGHDEDGFISYWNGINP